MPRRRNCGGEIVVDVPADVPHPGLGSTSKYVGLIVMRRAYDPGNGEAKPSHCITTASIALSYGEDPSSILGSGIQYGRGP